LQGEAGVKRAEDEEETKTDENKKKIVCQVRAELCGELGSVKLFFKMAKIMWFFGFLVAKFMI
jgi:hypothetical protein